MNSREIVQRTLNFENPERIAHSFEPSDFVFAGPEIPNLLGEWCKVDERQWQRTDEWGNIWGRVDDTSKGQIIRGILDDLNEVATFPLPNFANAAYYTHAKDVFAQEPDKWHIGSVQGFTFKMAQQLRRFDQYLIDLVVDSQRISQLHDRIDEQILWQIKRLHQAGADSVMFWEDWGTQSQTFINPKLWRAEFMPRFINLIAEAHALGLSVIMHSCGKITSILPDLIECGVDVFQFDQPRIHGIDTLSELQQGHVTFWCPVDIQTTLQSQNETLIRQEVRELVSKLWKGQGGFMAGFYDDEASIGLEPHWQQIACEEFLLRGAK
jgi:uroporphyrinogen decarboxylase